MAAAAAAPPKRVALGKALSARLLKSEQVKGSWLSIRDELEFRRADGKLEREAR